MIKQVEDYFEKDSGANCKNRTHSGSFRPGARPPGLNYIFMQDNGSIHISNAMKDWFDEQNIVLLDHPPISPDLKTIENVWGQLVRKIYANGIQYTSLIELKASI